MSYFAAYFGLFFAIGALLGFGFGYVYRGTRVAQTSSAPATAATEATKPATASAEVSSLPGMTPGVASSMAAAGIDSLAGLRAVGESDDKLLALADDLRLEDFALRKWVNVADLQAVSGVDTELATALLRVGVRGKAALAEENPDRVQNKLATLHAAEGLPRSVPDRATVVALIAEAAR